MTRYGRGSRMPFRKRKVMEVIEEPELQTWRDANRYRLDCGHIREVRFRLYPGLATNCYPCGAPDG